MLTQSNPNPNSRVQQHDGVLAGAPGVGAIELGPLVVADRLQQGAQDAVVRPQLAAVHRAARHAAVGVGLWGGTGGRMVLSLVTVF